MYRRREKRRKQKLIKNNRLPNDNIDGTNPIELSARKRPNSTFKKRNHEIRGYGRIDESDENHSNNPALREAMSLNSEFQKSRSHTEYRNINASERNDTMKPNINSIASNYKTKSTDLGDCNETDDSDEDQHHVDRKSPSENMSDDQSHDGSVVSIELIYCKHCERSCAPATHQKFCQTLDGDGNPKCLRFKKKRKIFNSAKASY
jgi:hypothetical protein